MGDDERGLFVHGEEEVVGKENGMEEIPRGGKVAASSLLAACSPSLRSVCCGGQGRVAKKKQRSTIA
jgi:hypothetical protein